MADLRLPPMPSAIRNLPRNDAGYPVPWFVATIDGKPDFRVIRPKGIQLALKGRLCWVCGHRMRQRTPRTRDAFVIGPMCAVNRNTAEPPAHEECALWSARACPFLTMPKRRRRELGLPDNASDPAGDMITRNPGVALVWISRSWRLRPDGRGGALFDVGDPVEVFWLAEGREATRDEVLASIESGLPILRESAETQGPDAMVALGAMVGDALKLLPT